MILDSVIQVVALLFVSGDLTVSLPHPLRKQDVETLVSNTPAALKAKKHGACLSTDYVALDDTHVSVQLRNSCPRTGSGFIENYVVDRNSGTISTDIDRGQTVDSARLRTLRRKLSVHQKHSSKSGQQKRN